jgi:hypothetical protein
MLQPYRINHFNISNGQLNRVDSLHIWKDTLEKVNFAVHTPQKQIFLLGRIYSLKDFFEENYQGKQ